MTTVSDITIGEVAEGFARWFSGAASYIGLERELFNEDSTRGKRISRLFDKFGFEAAPVAREEVDDYTLAHAFADYLVGQKSKRELDRELFGSTLSGGKTVVREWQKRFGLDTVGA